MRELRLKPDASNREPKLRHEFVGMMFAVAVGEVGLQTAALLQAGPIFRSSQHILISLWPLL